MIKLIFIIVTLFLAWKIIRSNNVNRLVYYLIVILFLGAGIILTKTPLVLTPLYFLTWTLTFVCIIKEPVSEWERFPLKKTIIFTFICLLLVGLFDSRLVLYLKIYRPAAYFVYSFFICYLSFLCFKDEEDWKKISKVLFFSTIIVCIYGYFNYLVNFNHYNDIICNFTGEVDVANRFQLASERPRISSFTSNAIYYGFLVGLIFVICLYNYIKKPEKLITKRYFIVIAFLLLVNLYLSNSRTPYMTFLIGVVCLFLLSTDLKGKIKYIIIIFIAGLVVVNVSSTKDRLDQLVDIFSSEQEVTGSSIEMRMEQLSGALEFFDHNIYTGNGFFYIIETIGFNLDEDLNKADKDLWGFESYIYELLIEQGIVGILGSLVFFVSVIYWLFHQRKYSLEIRQVAALGIAIVISFLTFSIATATLDSWYISMFFLGICLKRIVLMKEAILSEDIDEQDIAE